MGGSPSKSGGMAYDPNQNPEDKRRIRKRYRGLLLDETGTRPFGHAGRAL
jgi:hypothetical protein